jgi:hypothetical protein
MHIVNARIRSATASKLPRVVAPAVDINNQCRSYVFLIGLYRSTIRGIICSSTLRIDQVFTEFGESYIQAPHVSALAIYIVGVCLHQ